jgi:hypothetical protein
MGLGDLLDKAVPQEAYTLPVVGYWATGVFRQRDGTMYYAIVMTSTVQPSWRHKLIMRAQGWRWLPLGAKPNLKFVPLALK